MSHEIDMSNGRAAVMVAGQPPWHRLGVNVEQAVVASKAIQLSGLDWSVKKQRIYLDETASPDGDHIETHRAIVRTDTGRVLGVVGRTYEPVQNREAFDFFDTVVGEGQAIYETAGSLHGGRTIWVMAKLPRGIRVGWTDDLLQPYLLLVNTHDGSMALRMLPTTVRVVCQNTLNLAMSRGSAAGVAIRHTLGIRDQIAETQRTLGIVGQAYRNLGTDLNRLVVRRLGVHQVETYFKELVPDNPKAENHARTRQIRERMLANFENDRQSLRGIRHTPWAAWNAVSEWTDHQRSTRGKTETQRLNNRLDSIWFGSSATLKRRAFVKAVELATN